MKKIFSILFATFAIFVIFPCERIFAADVPDFLSVAGDRATYIGSQQTRRGRWGYFDSYSYECDVSDLEDLAVEYTEFLVYNFPFAIGGGFENDFTRTSARKFTTAFFKYTGSKDVTPFLVENFDNKTTYECQMAIVTQEMYDTGMAHFTIWISPSLIYAGG